MALQRQWNTRKKLTTKNLVFRQWKAYSEGDVFVGKYLKSYTDEKYGQKCYVFEVLDSSFKVEKQSIIGKNLVLNATGMLTKNMADVEVGSILQIEYCGLETIQKGKFKGKDSHTLEIAVVGEEGDEYEEQEEEEDDL